MGDPTEAELRARYTAARRRLQGPPRPTVVIPLERPPTDVLRINQPVKRDVLRISTQVVAPVIHKLPPTFHEIMKAICGRYGCREIDIKSHKRTADLTLPRHVFVYLARHLTPHTYREIGHWLGDRDHTSISAAYAKIRTWRGRERDIDEALQWLIDRLGGDPE